MSFYARLQHQSDSHLFAAAIYWDRPKCSQQGSANPRDRLPAPVIGLFSIILAGEEMNIEEMVDCLIADFEEDRTKAAKYFWWEAYERALTETDFRTSRSMVFAKTILCGRSEQLEQFPDDPTVWEELAALRVAIRNLRC